MSEQEHIRARIGARKAGARALVALGEPAWLTAAFDQAGDLLARIAAHALKKAQHHGLTGTLEAAIAEAAHRARDKLVALIRGHRKIDLRGSVQKSLYLSQRMQLFVVHIDVTFMPASCHRCGMR